MANQGKLSLTSATPVQVDAGPGGNIYPDLHPIYYFKNLGPGDVRIGISSAISDGVSGLVVNVNERVDIRHVGSLWVASSTATAGAPVAVNYLVSELGEG